MHIARRSLSTALVATLFVGILLALPVESRANPVLLRTAGKWCLGQILSYGARKLIDRKTGQDLRRQLEQEIPRLVAQAAAATGSRRAALQESLDLHREQLATLTRLTNSQGNQIAEIRADQERLLRRIDDLETRMAQLEDRVGDLDARVTQLEDALIRECLDLRHAPVLGADAFRIKESPGGSFDERFESDRLTLDMRLLLNSCTGDLTQRGLLIQLSLVTRGLDKDLSLYATFKGIHSGGRMGVLSRQEIPLARPGYTVDGQVVELFFPYGEIPDLSSPDRIALALVLTHDGEVLYTLPDRVLSCVSGQRVNCRWGR